MGTRDKKSDEVKMGVNLTPPLLGGLFGVKSTVTATKGGKTGCGDSAAQAMADLSRKSK